eukprot:1158720-Ditylum_brightwellii.AAC.1
MGQKIHQGAFDSLECPIQALACHIHHITSNGGTNTDLICNVYNKEWCSQVNPTDMIKVLCASVPILKLHTVGINPDLIRVHLLRSGGVMALKLPGTNDTTIMKMRRWSSLTFLMYIHNQIGHLAKDVTAKMCTELPFTNVAAIN